MTAHSSERRRKIAELSLAAMMHPLGPVLRAAAGQRVERDLLHRLAPILGAGELANNPEAAVTARFGVEAFTGLLPGQPGRNDLLGWALRWRRPFHPGDHVVAAAARLGADLLKPALGEASSEAPQTDPSRSTMAVAARALLAEVQDGVQRAPGDAVLAAESLASAAATHLADLPAEGEQCSLAERCRASGAMAAAIGATLADDDGRLPAAETFADGGAAISVALLSVGARSRKGNPGYAEEAAGGAATALGLPGSSVLRAGPRRAWLVVPEQAELLDRVLLALESLDATWMDMGEDAELGFAWQKVELGGAVGGGGGIREAFSDLERRVALARNRRLRHLARHDYESVFGVRPYEATAKKKKGGRNG
jgi:hypothetical protein